MKQESIKMEGTVIADLSNSHFSVELDNGMVVHATISGKIRQRNIRIAIGDFVQMDSSPYDLSNARITYRLTGNDKKKPSEDNKNSKNKKGSFKKKKLVKKEQ